jgi:hypothetical protein
MELVITGRNGALTAYKIITTDPDAAKALVKRVTTYSTFSSDDGITGSASKSDIAEIRNSIDSTPDQTTPKPASSKPRRIVSLEYAEANKLSHGRAWVCSANNVDMGIDPWLEGELICYVYE